MVVLRGFMVVVSAWKGKRLWFKSQYLDEKYHMHTKSNEAKIYLYLDFA